MLLRYVGGTIASSVAMAVLLMFPAWALTGSLDWPRGWLAVVLLVTSGIVWGTWFLVTDPDLVRERSTLRTESRADTVATGGILVGTLTWFVLSAVDALRWHALGVPEPRLSLILGLSLFLVGYGFVVWVLRVNSFAATVVKVQPERHQRVIDTGPYAVVRHPMYLGAIVFLAGLSLLLGSVAMALLAPLMAIVFLPRMALEEATLARELPGYRDYLGRVPSRIFPGIW